MDKGGGEIRGGLSELDEYRRPQKKGNHNHPIKHQPMESFEKFLFIVFPYWFLSCVKASAKDIPPHLLSHTSPIYSA